MANPYLVQALYGAKSSAPNIKQELGVEQQQSRFDQRPTVNNQRVEQNSGLPAQPSAGELNADHHAMVLEEGELNGRDETGVPMPSLAPNLTSPMMFSRNPEIPKNGAPRGFQRKLKDPVQSQAESQQHIHAARLRLMESEDPYDEEVPKEVQGRRTGSNVLPVGSKSTPATIGAPRRSTTPSTAIGSQAGAVPSIPRIVSLNSNVWPPKPKISEPTPPKAEPMRYLPPPGDYYDQYSLPAIFGTDYFACKAAKCFNCWSNECLMSSNWTQCSLECGICGTKDHQRKGCNMLYCSFSWHNEHGTVFYMDNLQIRPTWKEAQPLSHIGLLKAVKKGGRLDIIVPNLSHPIAQRFYRHDPPPKALAVKTAQSDRFSTQSSTLPSLPDLAASISGNRVNAGLDPRLRGRLADRPTGTVNLTFDGPMQGFSSPSSQPRRPFSSCPISSTEAMELKAGDNIAPLHPMMGRTQRIDRPNSYQSMHRISTDAEAEAVIKSDPETRIQELEDQVLDIQRSLVAKDREIRKLKAENEQLRGQENSAYTVGSKRLRYDAGGPMM
ncbi:hypothetical protein P280DRAFT_514156 [Massarina eburnea CBS 473.64]|uniref:Uncharacterized protein n=1 Tax=Massarina eburnea CBS 473.64 TaxID=1395130 RepID=A0A6A6SBX0_9PLEO|nr:hypothetical protein P280DRAFT_514156 [Massarina eburnea CBS 473.64]